VKPVITTFITIASQKIKIEKNASGQFNWKDDS